MFKFLVFWEYSGIFTSFSLVYILINKRFEGNVVFGASVIREQEFVTWIGLKMCSKLDSHLLSFKYKPAVTFSVHKKSEMYCMCT